MKKYLWANCAVAAMVLCLANCSTSWAKPVVLPSEGPVECAQAGDEPAKEKFSIELDITSKGIALKFGASAVKPVPAPAIDAVNPMVMPAYLDHLFKLVGDVLTPRKAVEAEAEVPAKVEKTRPVETQLFEQVNVRIKDVPFQQALKNLAHVSGVRIVPDYRDLRAARVNLNFPVSLTVEHTSVHTALQQLLHPLKLTYQIRDDVVMIVTMESGSDNAPGYREAKAKEELAQRLFEIGERSRRAGEYEKSRIYYQQVHIVMPTSLYGRAAMTRLAEIEDRMREAEEQTIPGRDEEYEQSYRELRNRLIPLGLVELSY